MLFLFSNIFLFLTLKRRKIRNRFTFIRKSLYFSCTLPAMAKVTLLLLLLASCEASQSQGRGAVLLLAVPSCGTRLKNRTQFNHLFQVCLLTEFLCSKVIKDGVQAAVEVGYYHWHLNEEADSLFQTAVHYHVLSYQILQADCKVDRCEAHQKHHEVDDNDS